MNPWGLSEEELKAKGAEHTARAARCLGGNSCPAAKAGKQDKCFH